VPDPCLRIRGHRRTDVAALGIGEHEHTLGAQRGDRALQHREACRAVRFEEGHLRFDDRETRESGNARVAEPVEAIAVDGQTPRTKKFGVRIDTRAERPPGRYGVGQSIAEPAHR